MYAHPESLKKLHLCKERAGPVRVSGAQSPLPNWEKQTAILSLSKGGHGSSSRGPVADNTLSLNPSPIKGEGKRFVIPTIAEGSDRGSLLKREILNQVQNDRQLPL